MWEAFEHAAKAGLDNLIAIVDINRLGQTGETMHGWDLDYYAGRLGRAVGTPSRSTGTMSRRSTVRSRRRSRPRVGRPPWSRGP